MLQPTARAQVCVLPNAVDVPPSFPPADHVGPFTFLFVGTLGYYPNADAAVFFCTQVVPRLRERTRRAFEVTIVGPGAPEAVQQLARIPEVSVVGAVPDVTPWYHDADAVVVPLRAGGGTRIKVLEAFSYRRPVVSTSLGIEGIDAVADEHVLLGNSPDELATQCLRLMDDRPFGEILAERAYALLVSAYSRDVQASALAAVS